MLEREAAELLVIDLFGVSPDAVGNDAIQLAREVDRAAVREMAAVVEIHREQRVAHLDERAVDGLVRLRARVRLHVRVLRAEQLLRAVDRELLHFIDDLAAAVVAAAGVALRVLVGEHRARGLEHGLRDEILGRDQLERERLPPTLEADQAVDLGIDLGEARARSVAFRARELVDQRDAPRVATAVEGSFEPDLHDRPGLLRVEAIARQRQHVRIVVAPRGLRRLGVLHERSAHAGEAIRGVAHSEAGAADHDRALGPALGDGARRGRREFRVVDRGLARGAEIERRVARALETLAQALLQREAAMIAREDDRLTHAPS